MKPFNPFHNWQPSANWQKILTVDAHTEGEPLRIITSGFPRLEGQTILEKRRYCLQNHDMIRKSLMWEPRGHADMYGAIITEAERTDSDFGVLFTHNEGYSTMCGHGILALTKIVFETGMLAPNGNPSIVKIDSPAGLIQGFAEFEKDKISSVYFHNVPSFAADMDAEVKVPGLGRIKYDLAFGGAFYAFVDASQISLSLVPENFRKIIQVGMDIKHAVMKSRKIEHPFAEDLSFLYGTIFISPPEDSRNHSRNVCVFAEGEVDRSPTGTGVSARAAIHHARGDLKVDEEITIESIIASKFTVSVRGKTIFAGIPAIIPRVGGKAYITGRHEFLINPDDSLKNGFILR